MSGFIRIDELLPLESCELEVQDSEERLAALAEDVRPETAREKRRSCRRKRTSSLRRQAALPASG